MIHSIDLDICFKQVAVYHNATSSILRSRMENRTQVPEVQHKNFRYDFATECTATSSVLIVFIKQK